MLLVPAFRRSTAARRFCENTKKAPRTIKNRSSRRHCYRLQWIHNENR